MSGKHFDVNNDQLVASFEQIKSQKRFKKSSDKQNSSMLRAQQLDELHNRLKNLSVEQLNNIYQYIQNQ